MKRTSGIRIVESSEGGIGTPGDARGSKYRVALIRSGWSRNNRHYSPEVLRDAAPMFEGAKVFAYEFRKPDGELHDHLPGSVDAAMRAAGRSFARNVIGDLTDVKFGDYMDAAGLKQIGLTADYNVFDESMRAKQLAAWKAGRRNFMEFSINADGEATPAIHEGRAGVEVRRIHKVGSVDLVTDPAAGGEVLRLVASMGADPSARDVNTSAGAGAGAAGSGPFFEAGNTMKRLIHDLTSRLAPALVAGTPRGALADAQAYGAIARLSESASPHAPAVAEIKRRMDAGKMLGPDGAEGALRGLLRVTEAAAVARAATDASNVRFAEAFKGMKKDLGELDEAKFKASYRTTKEAARRMTSDYDSLDESKFSEKYGFAKSEAASRMAASRESLSEAVADAWATLGLPALSHKLPKDPGSLAQASGPDVVGRFSRGSSATYSAPNQAPGVPRNILDGKDLSMYQPIRESVAALDREAAVARATIAEMRMMNAGAIMERRLTESRLPPPTQLKIRAMFHDPATVTDAGVLAAIEGERAYLTTLAESAPSGGSGVGILQPFRRDADVVVGAGSREKMQLAVDGFFLGEDACTCGRLEESVGGELRACRAHDRVPRFKSFRKMVGALMGVPSDEVDPYMVLQESRRFVNAGQRAKMKLQESLTSASWAFILGDSITRRLIAEYNLHGLADWRKIVSLVGPINDFRTNNRMRRGGYGVLPAVAEGAAYQSLVSPVNEQATYAISKRGGLEDLTLEMIANDDVGEIQAIPRALGRAAAQTLYRGVFDPIITNAAIYTGGLLATVGQANLVTAALSDASLTAARRSMMIKTAFGNATEFLGEANAPKFLLIGLGLEKLAMQLTTATSEVGTAAADRFATNPNLHSRYGLEYIPIPHWIETDAGDNDWACVANPRNVPTMEVGFFQGQEDPELFVQDAPTVGAAMSADKVTFKIRHIWGVVVLDFRGFHLSVVA